MTFARLRSLKAWLGTAPGVLALFAWLTGVLLQSGAFGTVDTSRRYQVTRALWRAELPVAPNDVGFGIVTASGSVHPWYGIGQSLLMLPGDLFAGAIVRVLGIGPPLREKLEMAITAFVTFPLITALTAVVAYSVLRELGEFRSRHAVAGVAAWLFASTVLHYVHVAFENSLDLLACLTIILFAWRWSRSGSRRELAIAAAAAGVNLLARIPNLVDASLLLATAVWCGLPPVEAQRRPWLAARVRDIALVWTPILLLSLAIDRGYHVARFGWGEVASTYLRLYGEQARLLDPSLPPNFPFSGSFSDGFWGPLIGKNRSVFLYDPLAVVALLLMVFARSRRQLPRAVGLLTVCCLATLMIRTTAFARLAFWDGSTSWSNRYTVTPVQLWTLFAVPLFLAHREGLGRWPRAAFWCVLAASLCLQLSSVLVHPNLEQIQAEYEHREVNMIVDRFANVRSELLGIDRERLSSGGRVLEMYRRIHLLPWDNAEDLPVRARALARGAWALGLVAWALALAAVRRRIVRDAD